MAGIDVTQHLGLAWSVARRYHWAVSSSLSLDDLAQAGTLGLLRAADKFDPDRGFRFATYAMWWVRQSIVREIENRGRTVRVPVHAIQELRRAGKPLPCPTRSYDAPLSSERNSDTLLSTIANDAPDQEEQVTAMEGASRVWSALGALPSRLRRVIVARHFEERTLEDIGSELGVTRERARQLQVKAEARLRKHLGSARSADSV